MKPKLIIVKDGNEKRGFDLPNIPIEVSNVDYDPETQVVYITNPKYQKGSKSESPWLTSAPLIALTKYDYEVIQWTN
jgi:hypothetical protein